MTSKAETEAAGMSMEPHEAGPGKKKYPIEIGQARYERLAQTIKGGWTTLKSWVPWSGMKKYGSKILGAPEAVDAKVDKAADDIIFAGGVAKRAGQLGAYYAGEGAKAVGKKVEKVKDVIVDSPNIAYRAGQLGAYYVEEGAKKANKKYEKKIAEWDEKYMKPARNVAEKIDKAYVDKIVNPVDNWLTKKREQASHITEVLSGLGGHLAGTITGMAKEKLFNWRESLQSTWKSVENYGKEAIRKAKVEAYLLKAKFDYIRNGIRNAQLEARMKELTALTRQELIDSYTKASGHVDKIAEHEKAIELEKVKLAAEQKNFDRIARNMELLNVLNNTGTFEINKVEEEPVAAAA